MTDDHDEKVHASILEAFKRPVRLPEGAFSLDKSVPKYQGRGRPANRSPYDDFINALKGAMQKQARLPRLRKGERRRCGTVELSSDVIREIADRVGSKGRVTAPKIWRRLDELRARGAYRGPMPSIFSVQKVLAEMRRKGLIGK